MAGRVILAPDEPYDGYDCKTCGNRGIILFEKANGDLCCVRCECMDTRRSHRKELDGEENEHEVYSKL